MSKNRLLNNPLLSVNTETQKEGKTEKQESVNTNTQKPVKHREEKATTEKEVQKFKKVTFTVLESKARRLKALAAEIGVDQQDLMNEAIDHILKKYKRE